MTRYILTYPDGLQMLIGIDGKLIRAIGPYKPKSEQVWAAYYEPARAKPASLQQLEDDANAGLYTIAPYDPSFEEFWVEYGNIYNQSTAKGLAGNGSKAAALKVWDRLNTEQRRAAFSYLRTYKMYLQQIAPTRYKKDAATYLNPQKGEWVI
jgi:hypothetical protein